MRALPRSVARKRRNWITIYDDSSLCTRRCIPVVGCQDEPGFVEIIPNTSLQSLFGDDVSVVRLVGDILWQPKIAEPNICSSASYFAWVNQIARSWYNMRIGLMKTEVNVASLPDGPVFDPLAAFDWSDGPWLKRWNHWWLPKLGGELVTIPENGLYGVCSSVTKASVNVPGWVLATGSGNWAGYTEPEITTDCLPVFAPSEIGCAPQYTAHKAWEPPVWRQQVNIRKKIRLRENDQLQMFWNFVELQNGESCSGSDCFPQDGTLGVCQLYAALNFRALIEYG